MSVFIGLHVARHIRVRLAMVDQNSGQWIAVRVEDNSFDCLLARQHRESKRKVSDDLSFSETDDIGLLRIGNTRMVEDSFGLIGVQADMLEHDAVAARLYPFHLIFVVLIGLSISHPIRPPFLDFDQVDAYSCRRSSLRIEDDSTQPAIPARPEGGFRASAIHDSHFPFLL